MVQPPSMPMIEEVFDYIEVLDFCSKARAHTNKGKRKISIERKESIQNKK